MILRFAAFLTTAAIATTSALGCLFLGCTTIQNQPSYGVQKGYEAFIPAEIAVLACQPWPRQARFATQLPLTMNSRELEQTCQEIDEHVIKGFDRQPFMRGFKPSLVKSLLARGGKKDLLSSMARIWKISGEGCKTCKDSLTTYEGAIWPIMQWRSWLHSFSKATRYCDAVLLPFLTTGFSEQLVDRGLAVSQRILEVQLLLVDTNNGRLQWIGKRKAYMRNQEVLIEGKTFPPYPEWRKLYGRVLTRDLWKDFPGKQW